VARGRTIWITRAEPGASATAARLTALGHEAIVEPLFELKSLDTPLHLEGVGALAFTSANGVRAFAERTPQRSLRVFAVGEATSEAARKAGFRTVLSTRGDVSALAAGIRTRKRELAGPVLHPGAAELAGDLAVLLAEDEIEVVSAALYQAVQRPLGEAVTARLGSIDAALLHSPNGSRALARFLRKTPAPQMTALCLSRQVARPLARAKGAGRIKDAIAARLPNEEELLNLLSGI
jgi:uroporphyrinogen-III synthase